MTHSSGLPSVFTPREGMYIDRLDEIVAAICENVHSAAAPGEVINYAPMAAHALMGESVRRTDPQKRSYRQLARDDSAAKDEGHLHRRAQGPEGA